jgi:N-acetylglucosamine malate deacetylase 2
MNILAFFAHPDDETMLCGGTLALLSREGARVHYLLATRGEGGECGDPPLCSREQLGQVREQELGCAVQALGGASYAFMGYIDPLVGPDDTLYAFESNLDLVVEQIQAHIRRLEVDVILTHGKNGEYGHPAHKLVNLAASLAVAGLQQQPLLYHVQADFEGNPKPHLANKDEPAHFIIDIEPVMPEKIAAALCHRTQNSLFVRRASEQIGRPLTVPEVIVPVESLHRAYPPVDGIVWDALADRLINSGCVRGG